MSFELHNENVNFLSYGIWGLTGPLNSINPPDILLALVVISFLTIVLIILAILYKLYYQWFFKKTRVLFCSYNLVYKKTSIY